MAAVSDKIFTDTAVFLFYTVDTFRHIYFYIHDTISSNNHIYFPRQLEDVFSPDPVFVEEVKFMSTYEELQLITSIALLVVAILTYTHKK